MRRALAIGLLCAGCSGGGRESLVEITGTVVVPKALVGTSVGMVYVGVWSELDAATVRPAADATLFGGTSSGSFTSADQRTICEVISGRTVRDEGANWAIDFVVPQMRFVAGSVVWAFADENLDTCDPYGGPIDNYQYLVDLVAAIDGGDGSWTVTMESADYSWWVRGGVVKADVELVDEGGAFWSVTALSDTNDTLRLTGGAAAPVVNGASKARLYQRENPIPYGAQFADVLQNPSPYLDAGDVFASLPETGAKTLDSLAPVVITLDTVVP